ncbi:hypothetical protein AA0119_g13499 [Alternaria tenuissima]|uniref:F-box domain-containing protein n=1 Tax=Alternaria tenuissima TaxID=119927 RepID=A0ABY0FNG8_9PLEO|nr:hypothetical protein AA0119_g13499 [Alternaria tenuissima]RYN98385.1 hypothetical protein AA0121_g13512 [Alternaria tenuissima]RYO45340.1 hypothetical protein AA0116_g13320 [Alternaria tenuissima]
MLDRTLKTSDTGEPAHVPPPETHTVIDANLDKRFPGRKRQRACDATQQEIGKQLRLTLEAARSETGCPSSEEPGQEVGSLEQELKDLDEQLEQVRQERKNIRDATKCLTTPNTTQAQPLNKSAVGNSHLRNLPGELLLLVAEFLDYADMRNLKDTCKRLSDIFRPDWEKLTQRLDKFENGLTKSTSPPTDSCTPRTNLTPTTGYAEDDLVKLRSWAKRILWKEAHLKENIRNVLVQNAMEQVHRDDMPTCLEWLEQDKWRKEFAPEAFTKLGPRVQLFFTELMKATWRDHSDTVQEQFLCHSIAQELARLEEEGEPCSESQRHGNLSLSYLFCREWANMGPVRMELHSQHPEEIWTACRDCGDKVMDDPYLERLMRPRYRSQWPLDNSTTEQQRQNSFDATHRRICRRTSQIYLIRRLFNNQAKQAGNFTMKMSDTAEPAHVLPPETHTVINANLDRRSPRRKRKRACGATQQETGEQPRLTLKAARSETGCLSSKKPGQEVESLEQEYQKVTEELKQTRQKLENIRDTTKCSTTPNTTQAQPLTDLATPPASSLTQSQTQIVNVNMGSSSLPVKLFGQILLYCVVPPGQGTDAVDFTMEGVLFLFASASRVHKTWQQTIKDTPRLQQFMFLRESDSPTKPVLNPFISRITKVARQDGQRGNCASASWRKMLVAHVSTPYMYLEARGVDIGTFKNLHYMTCKSNVRMCSLVECVAEPISEISMREGTKKDGFTYAVTPYKGSRQSKGDVISYQKYHWNDR